MKQRSSILPHKLKVQRVLDKLFDALYIMERSQEADDAVTFEKWHVKALEFRKELESLLKETVE